MGEFVKLEVADGIGTILLNRPPVNALNDQLTAELADGRPGGLGHGRDPRGDHLRRREGFAGRRRHQRHGRGELPRDGHPLGPAAGDHGADRRHPKPVVAAITGYALGGGLELALAADFRVAGESARVGQPEILLGIIPGAGGTQRLPRLVGPAKAKDIVFSGRMLKAAEAHAIGLVDLVAPDDSVYQAALDMVKRYAAGPALALRAAKQAIDHGLDVDLATGLEIERVQFAALFGTEDQRAGMRSFLENGPGKATFTGR